MRARKEKRSSNLTKGKRNARGAPHDEAACFSRLFIPELEGDAESNRTSSVYRLSFRASTQQWWQTMMSSRTTPDSSLLTR
jgi:hypothetical protein